MSTRVFLMRNVFPLLLAGLALSGAGCRKASIPAPIDKEAQVQAGDYKLSGPYTHDNLTIYLIHGDDKLKDKELLTLEEALEQKKVVVYETQNVNELAIENTSDQDVFIQSGVHPQRRSAGSRHRDRPDCIGQVGQDTARCILRGARPLEPTRRRSCSQI